jgi:hypothetical protein
VGGGRLGAYFPRNAPKVCVCEVVHGNGRLPSSCWARPVGPPPCLRAMCSTTCAPLSATSPPARFPQAKLQVRLSALAEESRQRLRQRRDLWDPCWRAVRDYPAHVAALKARMAALKIQRVYRGEQGRRRAQFALMQKRLKGVRQVWAGPPAPVCVLHRNAPAHRAMLRARCAGM